VSDSRCPQCAAIVRPDARWCSLCHASLGQSPVADLGNPSGSDPSPADPAGSSAAPRARGRHAKGRDVVADVVTTDSAALGGSAVTFDDLDLVAMGLIGGSDPLLDPHGQLAMFDEGIDVDRIDLSALADRPVVSSRWNDLASRLDSNGAKAVVMVGVAVGMSVLIFGFLTLAGMLFT
jgi:hypothetical protein